MSVETPAEACAALAVLIAGADGVGSIEEGRFLFDDVANMPIFEELDRLEFAALMSDTVEFVWSTFPNDGEQLSDEGVVDLLSMICAAVTPDLRADAFRMAVGMAKADGVSSEERVVLEVLCAGLEIDPAIASEFLDPL